MILMNKEPNNIEFYTKKVNLFKKFTLEKTDDIFSERSLNFLDDLSKVIIKNKKSRAYPDLITFAFFIRKSNINKLKNIYKVDNDLRMGRGVVFHISPSNVPINFAYSMVAGILSGNNNIIRVPTKKFIQTEIIADALNKLFNNNKYFENKISLISYSSSSTLTSELSKICDVRVIWGGDETIKNIRKFQLPVRAFDVTFSDRYSLSVINADEYIDEKNKFKIAENFFYDTYLFDQNACTSPHLIFWIGKPKNIKKSKDIFWTKIHNYIKNKYTMDSVISVDKLTSYYKQLIEMENLSKISTDDNLIWRIKLNSLNKHIENYRCSSGYFNEYDLKSLDEISHIINKKYQTLSYYGINKKILKSFIEKNKPMGIDRIVPIGKTSEFSLNWDGYDLISSLSRSIQII